MITGLVSVIIPVKNAQQYLAEAMKSVQAQTYRPLEMIVMDGHSSDDTEKIASGFQDVRFIRQEGDGLWNALNQGIGHARGEFVSFLSSDDIWTPDKLALQVDYMNRNSDAGYTVSLFKFFLEEGQDIPDGFKAELLEGDHVGNLPEALLARKSLFDQVGTFTREMAIAADVDWFARVKDRGIHKGIIEQVTLFKRAHAGSLSLQRSLGRQINHELLKAMRASILRQRGETPNRG